VLTFDNNNNIIMRGLKPNPYDLFFFSAPTLLVGSFDP